MVRMSSAGQEENLFLIREGTRRVAKNTFFFSTKGREEHLSLIHEGTRRVAKNTYFSSTKGH